MSGNACVRRTVRSWRTKLSSGRTERFGTEHGGRTGDLQPRTPRRRRTEVSASPKTARNPPPQTRPAHVEILRELPPRHAGAGGRWLGGLWDLGVLRIFATADPGASGPDFGYRKSFRQPPGRARKIQRRPRAEPGTRAPRRP